MSWQKIVYPLVEVVTFSKTVKIMIGFVCALHLEAMPIVRALGMKKDLSVLRFELFYSDKAALIISGMGKLKAAIATTVLEHWLRQKKQLSTLVNFGICGGTTTTAIGEAFECIKILDGGSGKRWYTDPILTSPFARATVITADTLVLQESKEYLIGLSESLPAVFEMEASGFCEAATVDRHQLTIIKVVSDQCAQTSSVGGNPSPSAALPIHPPLPVTLHQAQSLLGLTKEKISLLIEPHIKPVLQFAAALDRLRREFARPFEAERADLLERCAEFLHLTTAQRHILSEALFSFTVRTATMPTFVEDLLRSPLTSKQETKERLHLFFHRLAS